MTDDALVRLLKAWDGKLRRLQRAHPSRWYVPGLSDDEVRDAITLELVERARAGESLEHVLAIASHRVTELRRNFRIRQTPMDLRDATLWRNEPGAEERFIEREADENRASARERAEARLSKPQQRWLMAMREAANDDAFFESSGDLNLSAASRVLGKHRSSATRVYEQIRARFNRELNAACVCASRGQKAKPSSPTR